MPNSIVSQSTSTFTSWKEIAVYLGKGVRTVQRWEQELGLPVLRPNGKPSGVVSASRAELDRWWARHWSHGNKSSGNLALAAHESVTVAWENIRASRELRNQSLQLVQQLSQSTQSLAEECQRLIRSMKQAA